jgi:protocatechuate 3,4-dioxygenase beta subunit
MKLIFTTLLLFFLNYDQSYQSADVILNKRKYTTPLSEESDIYARPKQFPRTNNLRRKTGSPFIAKGEYLSIEGYITDLYGVPMENVVVKIWQANAFGYYQNLLTDSEDEYMDIDFYGSGVTTTDTNGYYGFISIMPGYYGNRSPHIHFLLQHEYFGELELEMFFPNHPRNIYDKKYLMMSPLSRSLATSKISLINPDNPSDGKRALFNIVLDTIHPQKRY